MPHGRKIKCKMPGILSKRNSLVSYNTYLGNNEDELDDPLAHGGGGGGAADPFAADLAANGR